MSAVLALAPRRDESESAPDFAIERTGLEVRVPDAVYQAVYVRHDTCIVFGTPKVFLWFRVVEPGAYFGKELCRPYRARSVNTKRRKFGAMTLSPRSEMFLMLCRVLDVKERPDRISPFRLRGTVLSIKTRTVKIDYKQRPLQEALWYSVVEDVVGILTTGGDSS